MPFNKVACQFTSDAVPHAYNPGIEFNLYQNAAKNIGTPFCVWGTKLRISRHGAGGLDIGEPMPGLSDVECDLHPGFNDKCAYCHYSWKLHDRHSANNQGLAGTLSFCWVSPKRRSLLLIWPSRHDVEIPRPAIPGNSTGMRVPATVTALRLPTRIPEDHNNRRWPARSRSKSIGLSGKCLRRIEYRPSWMRTIGDQ